MVRFPAVRDVLIYLFWPNPGNASYASPKALVLLTVCGALICASLGVRGWRRRVRNPVMRRLSASWASAALWFGLLGVLLVVSSMEGIQFLAMRFLWFLWGGLALAYLMFQIRQYRSRHYTLLPRMTVRDPREEYLPRGRSR